MTWLLWYFGLSIVGVIAGMVWLALKDNPGD